VEEGIVGGCRTFLLGGNRIMIVLLKHIECIIRMIELKLFIAVVHHRKNFLVNALWCMDFVARGHQAMNDICG